MTHRIPLEARPWLAGGNYDRLAALSCLHYDLWAYTDGRGYYFLIEARQGGKALQARSLYALCPLTGALTETFWSEDFAPLHWTARSAAVFKRVHGRLLGVCRLLPGYARVSVLCHYVNRPDENPWPRGMVNTFRYTIRPDDPRYRSRQFGARVKPEPVKLPDVL